ncbi:hypothetical protein BJ508DRAFT_216449 [Ascobolus immersus RN42]|uniref:CENP-V/GFA domain-containing protein n=1 Tax=Ascobolus immersus RN42 TaxID=1160509 RepID=A0A3N4HG65_ASCIM|nr:hypothetical protein BJ508DRAFT_216449 [Ascobolus immersus RN42]
MASPDNPITTPTITGGCYCNSIRYTITPPQDTSLIRTSLCHCRNCKKFTGSPYGITTRLPIDALTIRPESLQYLKTHESDNGSGSKLTRQFCGECGSGILEYGEQAKEKWRYVFWGTLDEEGRADGRFGPKGEFFASQRAGWLAPVEGTFQKEKITE